MEENSEYDKKRLRTFIRNVRQEILNLQAGESKYRTSALHFETGVSGDSRVPVMFRLEQFENHPSKKNLESFLELASQDLSARAGIAFEGWSRNIFPQTPEALAKAQIKPFDLQIKDGFYDLFRAAQIPMTPQQVDLIMTHSGKLAKAFQGEIHKTIKDQLETLVAKLKTQEEKEPTDKPPVVETGQNSSSSDE